MAAPHRSAASQRLGLVLGLATLIAGCNQVPGEATAGSPPPPPRTPAPPPRVTPELARFFRALERLQVGETDHVHILMLGDSHTAGDYFSGRLRALFQDRFGDAGRGMMPPGLAFDGLRQSEVTVSQTGRWAIDNSLFHPDDGPYGVSGFTARSASAGATMTVAPTGERSFERATVDYLVRPGGGRFEIVLDGRVVETVSTDGPRNSPAEAAATAPSGAHVLTIVAQSTGIAITAWSIERQARGVLLESHGVSGATVNLANRWDPAIVAHDFKDVHPALVILAYGTNEGFQDFSEPAYADTFTQVLGRMKGLAPDASILVVGPPDGRRVDPACPTRKTLPMACRWDTPPPLPMVRTIQWEAAQGAGAAFWDWSSVMSEPGGIDRWARLVPPLARQDHVHFTVAGYELAANALFSHLMERYDAFRAAFPLQQARRS